MKYLKLLHWKSLLLLISSLLLIKLTLFDPFTSVTLNGIQLVCLCVSAIAIAGAGFLLDELVNPRVPHFLKLKLPQVNQTKRIGYRLYFTLNIIGVLLGFYLSNLINRPAFSILFILSSALLYLKAYSFYNYILLRPLTNGLLMGLSFIAIWLFDIFPAMTPYNQNVGSFLFNIIVVYAVIIGFTVFVRGLIADQLYMDQDYKNNSKSLSLSLGRERTNRVIFALISLLICVIIYFLITYLYRNTISLIYVLALLIVPLIFLLYKILNASRDKEYRLVLKIMDLILFFSILSVSLYQFQYLMKT